MTKIETEVPFKPGKLLTVQDAIRYIQAGDATVTLKSLKTDMHYTYRVRESDDGNVFFVAVMWGTDNESDYSYKYIGIIKNGECKWTRKSKVAEDDIRWKAFQWVYNMLAVANIMPPNLEIWHEGRCGRCNHKLTRPDSIERGIGPECWKHFKCEPVQKTFDNMLAAG